MLLGVQKGKIRGLFLTVDELYCLIRQHLCYRGWLCPKE